MEIIRYNCQYCNVNLRIKSYILHLKTYIHKRNYHSFLLDCDNKDNTLMFYD